MPSPRRRRLQGMRQLNTSRFMQWISTRRHLAGEGGFTIIEAAVAMMLVALIFTALSAGLIGGLRATRDTRLFQQATSMGEEAVEAGRDLQYDTLVMQTSDLAGDPRIAAGPTFDPDASGPLLAEPVVATTSGGSVVPHITTETVVNTTFTTSRYVTWVDNAVQGGPAQSYKRLVVIVEWQIEGRTNSYITSSFIALARRGLPVPKFELAPETQTEEVEEGNLVVFPHTVRNLGIVDTYDLEMPNTRGWIINFYKDEDQNGTFESAVDSLLLDTNSTGKPDTGSVATDEITYFLAVFQLAPSETPGTEEMTLTATSGGNDTVSDTSINRVDIGTVGLTLNLHNNPTPPTGNTNAQKNLTMDINPVSAATLYQYSRNHYNTIYPGRFIDKSDSSDSQGDSKLMANWVYQVPKNTKFNGEVVLKLWVAAKDLRCDKGFTIRTFLRTKNSEGADSGTELTSADLAVSAPGGTEPCNFREVTLPMTLTNVTVATNKFIELKVTIRNTSDDAALIAYDTTSFNSTLTLPQVST
jgi:type II secretory pathway pseudopilin PulG